MSIRVLAGRPKPSESVSSHARRRRHTVEHGHDRLLRRISRILGVAGALMIIWLLLSALGWI